MGTRDIRHNTTSFIGKVFLRDSTTGLGKTGVAAASMSGDYCKDDNSADVALSFASGAVGDAYSSGKWAEIGNGWYFYHYPNGCWTTLGETGFSFRASGAIDAAPKFRVVAFDAEDATDLGLSNLDAAISSRLAVASAPSNWSSMLVSVGGGVTVATSLDKTGYSISGTKQTLDSLNDIPAGTAMALTPSERSSLAGVIDLAIINQGDGADLISAIADAIAADWISGDASPLAIVSALKSDMEWMTLIADAAAAKVASQSNTASIALVKTDTAAIVTDVQVNIPATLAAQDAAIATIDSEVGSVKAVTDKIDTGLESDGALGYQFTTLALENAPGGGSVTVGDITAAALAKFVTTDTMETTAANGSVSKISQGAAGGNVTVGELTQAALAQFATVDTGETELAAGSVCKLSGGYIVTGSLAVTSPDVRAGVALGDGTFGTLEVPDEADVESGVGYGANGTEFTGSLTSLPTINDLPVINNGNAKAIMQGDTYDRSFDEVPEWTWPTSGFPAYAEGCTARLVARNKRGDEVEIDLGIAGGESPVVLYAEWTSDQSALIQSGQYRYDIEVTFPGGQVKTMTFGDLKVYRPYSD